jgi:hypothetical protein
MPHRLCRVATARASSVTIARRDRASFLNTEVELGGLAETLRLDSLKLMTRDLVGRCGEDDLWNSNLYYANAEIRSLIRIVFFRI